MTGAVEGTPAGEILPAQRGTQMRGPEHRLGIAARKLTRCETRSNIRIDVRTSGTPGSPTRNGLP